jgi:chitin disaccharide deacetylase
MRYLVVNADDFGACAGVNHGIVEAHRRGIVTSTSLMVGMPGSEEAAGLARECPRLSVGLHAVVEDPDACEAALDDQLVRFNSLLDRQPSHLDSHHHVHTRPGLLAHFRALAERFGIPLRACSGVRYCTSFYAQWAGERHPEQVSAAGLIRILATEVGNGITELACHPGRADPGLSSSYAVERQLELRALCDQSVRRFLDGSGIALVSFGEVTRLLA